MNIEGFAASIQTTHTHAHATATRRNEIIFTWGDNESSGRGVVQLHIPARGRNRYIFRCTTLHLTTAIPPLETAARSLLPLPHHSQNPTNNRLKIVDVEFTIVNNHKSFINFDDEFFWGVWDGERVWGRICERYLPVHRDVIYFKFIDV